MSPEGSGDGTRGSLTSLKTLSHHAFFSKRPKSSKKMSLIHAQVRAVTVCCFRRADNLQRIHKLSICSRLPICQGSWGVSSRLSD